MARFAGIKNNKICVISEKRFENPEFTIIQIPPELDHVSTPELMSVCKIRNGQFIYSSHLKPAKKLKVALVGNWKMKCGISTYSENLWPQVAKLVGDVKLFIEHNDNLTGDIYQFGDSQLMNDQVVECWKRGESTSKLVDEIRKYEPDIVWIQHEFGLWSNARHWLSMLNQLSEYRVIVTMHSTFYHRDKTIVEAAIPEIIVHLPGAQDLLKKVKGVPGKVHMIPHGCDTCTDPNRLWNFYKSDRTFMQFGFGFRYKGWENALHATAILKEKYEDVFFTGLFSESPYAKAEHQSYYEELMSLVEKLNIKENVAIIRGFQSDKTLDSYLRTNQATMFSYVSHPDHEVFGASGAARLAMSKAIPVITSSVNHFSDLPTIKADTPKEIANALDKLFGNWSGIAEQVAIQNKYLEETSWQKVANMHVDIFNQK